MVTAAKAVSWFKEFEFDLPPALIRELAAQLVAMGTAPLDFKHVNQIPEVQGVYQLFLKGVPVYVGKTDSEAGLKKRLARHAKKIQQRDNLTPSDVTFRAVHIYVFTALDMEQQLIKHFEPNPKKQKLKWNHSGFGSNDPGRNRDKSRLKKNHFDLEYKINLDVPLSGFPQTGPKVVVADALAHLKASGPFLIRYETVGTSKKKVPHPELMQATISIPTSHETPRSILQAVQRAMTKVHPDWHVTVLPGYVIMYKESLPIPSPYVHARPL